MDSTFIAATVLNIWNAWNIRGFMILSLCLQIVLTLAAPLRKKTSNVFVTFVVWSAYSLSEWAATFAFGRIFTAGNRSTKYKTEVAQDVMAFWAAFLLIHLGGPNTITAFSLEDNALWIRHLAMLITLVFLVLYIFMKSLSTSGILIPTVLIFVVGVIKYGGRTMSLCRANSVNLKTIKKTPKNEDDETHFPADLKQAIHFQKILRGLTVDIMPNISERNESREFILQKDGNEVFRLILIELDFLYEFFYTKIMAADSGWGVFTHGIAYSGTLAAFILFCLADKDEFRKVDIAITYALFAGVFVLDVASGVMVAMSDRTNTNDQMNLSFQVIGLGFFPFLVGIAVYAVVRCCFEGSAFISLMDRVWSEKMGSFNLLSHCFRECAPRKCRKPGFVWEKLAVMRSTSKEALGFVWEKLAVMRSTSKEAFNPELWGLVFKDLERKATNATDAETMRQVYEARGDWAIEESLCHELLPYINDFEYDNTLLIWHIATEICYNIEGDVGYADDMKKYSKILSDYMLYLLVNQPKLMSAVTGISHVSNEDTCAEVKLLGRNFGDSTMQEFCGLILEEQARVTEPALEVKHCANSVLNDACSLVRLIGGNNRRWEIFFKVWMELLSYAAGHCNADSHAQLLSEGGEFITFVWMLMAHYGIGARFPVE